MGAAGPLGHTGHPTALSEPQMPSSFVPAAPTAAPSQRSERCRPERSERPEERLRPPHGKRGLKVVRAGSEGSKSLDVDRAPGCVTCRNPKDHTHRINIYIKEYIYIYIYIHTYLHTYIHTYIHTYLHTYIPTYLHTYIPTYSLIHTYIHTYIHTHTHTYTHIHIRVVFHSSPCLPALSSL